LSIEAVTILSQECCKHSNKLLPRNQIFHICASESE
jgi:hypothetical protein